MSEVSGSGNIEDLLETELDLIHQPLVGASDAPEPLSLPAVIQAPIVNGAAVDG